jgi:hypothetical protein
MLEKERYLGILVLIFAFILSLPMMASSAEKKVVRIWHTETEPQTVAAFQKSSMTMRSSIRISPYDRRGWPGATSRPS